MKLMQIGCGLVVLIVIVFIGLAAIVYPSIRKARVLSQLSSNRIDVVMHDPTTLNSSLWYSPQAGAHLQFPAELPAPMLESLPKAKVAFIAMKPGQASFEISVVDISDHGYMTEVLASRASLLKSGDMKLIGEGTAFISGMKAFIFDVRMTATPIRGRLYVFEGPNHAAYLLMGMAPESRWTTYSDISDSAASTFAFGEPPAGPVAAAPPLHSSFSVNRHPTIDQPTPAPPSPSPDRAPSAMQPATPVQPFPNTPADNSQRPASGPIEVLVDGSWHHGVIFKRAGDKTQVHYMPFGEPPQTVWATDDQLRPFNPEHLRAEMEAARAARHSAIDTPASHLPQAKHTEPITPATPTPAAPSPNTAPPTSNDTLTLDTAAKLLTSPAASDQTRAIEFLANASPDSTHRVKIINALRPLLDADKSIALPAARALALWCDDSAERDVISQFQRAPREKRRSYFEFLTARKTRAAARAIAARLHVSEDVISAEAALESMGSMAEPAARDLVADKDPAVAKYAIDVLASIGTKDSLPALDKATENTDVKVSSAALSAMQRIQGRAR